MANQKITQLTALTNSNVDVADVLPIVDVSGGATDKITYQNLMRPKDSIFGVVDSADITKIMAFELSGLTTATTRTLTVPDADLTIVGTATTQTLTNKTLTSPVINLTSDSTGDIYYRNGAGLFTRLPIGTSGQILQTSAGGIPEWIANPSAADASTTVKGVVEIATTAQITAGTGAGETGALLVVPASAVGAVGASKIVQFNSSTQYPAADGSLITNITNPITYVNGTFQQNANSTTTTTIAHGLGKTPKIFRVTGVGATGTGNANVYSYGSYNGTNNRSAHQWHDTNGSSSGTNIDTTAAIWISYASSSGSGQTLYIKGVVTWDATNVTITWTNGGAGNSSLTISYTWEAES